MLQTLDQVELGTWVSIAEGARVEVVIEIARPE